MSLLHLRHVRSFLEANYASTIDMSDCTNQSEENKAIKLLSRGLALFGLINSSGIDKVVGSQHVIDGFDDNGIDAVFHDQNSDRLIIVQSKYIQSGEGGPEQGEIKKYCDGIKDLIRGDTSRFNSKFQKISPSIQMALDNTKTKIRAILIFTGTQLSQHCNNDISRLCDEINDPSEYIEFEIMTLPIIHKKITSIMEANQINFDLMLNEWGATEAPFKSFYGQANCYEIVSIFDKYGGRLFIQNIRKFLGDNEINEAIKQTIINIPDQFFFLNNGITILCENAEKTIMGGSDRKSGTFYCTGAQIINGAQTVGSLFQLYKSHKENLEKSRVFVRVISMNSTDSSVPIEITRATNTQNKVEKKDFATLDPNQERLRREFYLENIQYQYKSGDIKEKQESITIEEAATALAVASSNLSYTILAKKEIGRLFEQIDAPPYSTLFTDSTTATFIGRNVQICRKIDSFLEKYRITTGDTRHIATHGNRIVQFIAYDIYGKQIILNPSIPVDTLNEQTIDDIVTSLLKYRRSKYPDALLSRLFYNQTKTKDLIDSVIQELSNPVIAKN